VPNTPDGARIFLDEDLVDALGAADVATVLENLYAVPDSHEIFVVTKTLGHVGSGILQSRLAVAGFDQKRCLQTARELERRRKGKGLLGDLLIFSVRSHGADAAKMLVKDLEFALFEIEPQIGNLSQLSFESCVFRLLSVDTNVARPQLPIFKDCLFEAIEGFLSDSDLPKDHFQGCEVERFVDGGETNTAISKSDLPAQIRVVVTILRKLFVRSLSGRQIGGLRRGIDLQDQRYVDDTIKALIRHNLATTYGRDTDVVIPVRRQRQRAMAIIASPLGSTDPLLDDIKGTT